MTHDDALRIPPSLRKTEEKAPRKPRAVTELPTELIDGDNIIVIANQSLEELIGLRATIKGHLEDVPKMELELRAVVAEIRKKAKV